MPGTKAGPSPPAVKDTDERLDHRGFLTVAGNYRCPSSGRGQLGLTTRQMIVAAMIEHISKGRNLRQEFLAVTK